jgi:nucleoside-diphosphate-sugar epimerase
MTPLTLVVGAGYSGQRFLQRQPSGAAVALSRSSGFDLDSADATTHLPASEYAVLYTVPPSPEFDTDVRLERLLGLLDPAPTRFVYVSTTGVYGDCAGERVTEDRPAKPQSGRARLRLSAETLLEGWCSARGVALIILRVPGIYGPGRLGIGRIKAGAANIDEAEANPGNRIHVDDLVRCYEAALSAAVPAGIYNVGDGDHRSATWFAAEVARQCGLAAPPTISRARAATEFSAMRMSFLGEARRIDTTRMRSILRVTPSYEDPALGIAASLPGAGSGS